MLPAAFDGSVATAAAVAIVAALGLAAPAPAGPAASGQAVPEAGDISGVVRSAAGPEEGVWVIAETDDLATRFIKSVVTGDGGRFLIPDLPPARYEVWVRGYGLADSARVEAAPGDDLAIEAAVAATEAEAAKVYPANYWYSLIEPPAASEFPGTGADGNGIATTLTDQSQWVDIQKQGCMLCHQLGSRIVREIDNRDEFDSTLAAWDHRVQMGQRGSQMTNVMNRFGRSRGLEMFADWSDRIAAGAVPPRPPRPAGVERNVVVTMWEWGNEIDYIHDEIATDKRNPTVNANGPIYGVNISNDELTMLDPVTHEATSLPVPLRADPATVAPMIARSMPVPSRFFGDELIWNDPANPHNPMMDEQGRVWLTSAIRPRPNPDWCKEGSDNRFARYFPIERGYRGAVYYDPPTESFEMIDTCFGTHHLQFAEDDDHTLFFSGGGAVVGWLETAVYDETGDEQASQGWCPTVIDTNGDGVITQPWNEPNRRGQIDAFDPSRDTRLVVGSYGIVPDPLNDTGVWVVSNRFPGRLAYLDIGDDPPETCLTEVYEVPSALDPNVPPRRDRLRAARPRHRPPRRGLDRALRQQPLRVVRPLEVRGPQRAGGARRAALRRRLDALPDARPRHPGDRPADARRLPLLQLGGPARHARPRRERPDRQRLELRLAARAAAGDRRVGGDARALSAGLLQPRPRRADRRSGRRLEGPRRLGHLRRRRDVAHRGRRGRQAGHRQVPGPPRPARELTPKTEQRRRKAYRCRRGRRNRRC